MRVQEIPTHGAAQVEIVHVPGAGVIDGAFQRRENGKNGARTKRTPSLLCVFQQD
jgi:hypothetical protein